MSVFSKILFPTARSNTRGIYGFTLVELMLLISILAVLIGVVTPTITRQRESARLARCHAELASHAAVIATYASDQRDLWPNPLSIDPTSGTVRYRHHSPVDYEIVGGVWHLALLDAYSYQPLHESLVCPSDGRTRDDRDAASADLGIEPAKIGGTLVRRLSMAMHLSPAALDPKHPRWGPDVWTTMKHSSVLFPARKAALIETIPFHDDRFPDKWVAPPPWRLSVGACDGSVSLRDTDACTPPVLPRRRAPATPQLEEDASRLTYTALGVRGIDW